MSEFYPVFVALGFNAIDLFSGVLAAIKNKNIESSKLRDGLFKKVGFMLCYFIAWLVDTYGETVGFSLSFGILPIVVFYVCSTELVSILENIAKINTDLLPEKLLEIFHIKDIGGAADEK